MVSQFILQISEMPIYGIGGVGYLQVHVVVPGKQPRKIGLQAPVSTSELFVHIAVLACGILFPFAEKIFPFVVPCGKTPLKTLPVGLASGESSTSSHTPYCPPVGGFLVSPQAR